MICKLDGRVFGEAIVEVFEEISFAEDIGVIGNHNSCFAEGSATASEASPHKR